ncbi:MAG: helicase, partial [Aquificaceae bacterium]|nr:helicase [Aquificaceae bacterium]
MEFYDKVIKAFSPIEEGGIFTGAVYYPARYEKELDEEKEEFIRLYQRNLYEFMRRLMVKRFESSFGAFLQSLRNFKEVHETAREFAEKTGKFILDRRLMEELLEEDEDTIEKRLKEYAQELKELQTIREYYKVYEISEFEKGEQFLDDIRKDIELFESLEKELIELGLTQEDPKAKRLIEGIKDFLKEGRKVVIFTEYVDTALHLKDILEKEFGEKLLTAIGNVSKQTSLAIL